MEGVIKKGQDRLEVFDVSFFLFPVDLWSLSIDAPVRCRKQERNVASALGHRRNADIAIKWAGLSHMYAHIMSTRH